MKRIVLVLNGKGGVGKSFFAVNLVQYLKDSGVPHVAFDTDNENSTLKRFHPEASFVDLAQSRQLDAIFDVRKTSDLTVVDCRAASSDLFLDYFREVEIGSVLAELGTRLTVAIPINHDADSVDQVQRITDSLGGMSQYLVVRNAAHSASFALYESLAVRARLLTEWGAREIELPRLQDWLVEALNGDNLTITRALTHPALSLLDRQRMRGWQRRFYASLEEERDLIVPGKGEDHG